MLGSVLRTHCAILGSIYLRSGANNASLDRCLLTDLRRPTFGNQVAFLRACGRAKQVPWGLGNDVVSMVRNLLKRSDPAGLPSEPRPLLDALVSYRNRTIHAGVGLRNDEAGERLPILETRLQHLLTATANIKTFQLSSTPYPTLSREGKEVLLVPGFEKNTENFLGVLEGWDSKTRTLHYVAAAREWDSKDRWQVWTDLLRSRGLLPAHWDEIDERWLRARARALLPERFRFPDGFLPAARFLEDVWLCVEANGRVAAKDPGGTMALLCASAGGRIVFAVTPDDPAWSLKPFQALTCLLGAQPDLEELPAGHPLESLVSRVVLVFPEYGVAGIPRWETLESDFAGLRVIRVDRSSGEEGGVTLDSSLLAGVRSALMDQATLGESISSISEAPPPPLTWDSLVREARLASLPGTSPVFDERVDALLAEFIPEQSGPETPESLVSICRAPGAAEDPWRTLLLDLGMLRADSAGGLQFTDPVVRARLFARALALAPDRPAARFLSEPPGEPEESVADVILQTIRARKIRPAPSSPGEAIALAREAVLGRIADAVPAAFQSTASLWKACAYLVRWRRPDLVAALATQFGTESALLRDPDLELEIGKGIRRHGTPQAAADFFEAAIERVENEDSARLQQQLAGVLRDRGGPGDRERAEGLYAALLARDDLNPEFRLHATCGAAENLYLMNRIPEAMTILEKARADARSELPRLRALVEHRLADAKARAGLHLEALALTRSAIAILEGRLQGSFASRLLDSHARFLATAGLEDEAQEALARSISIKRAIGDRRGLQISLIFLSALLQREDTVGARAATDEALELAEAAGDALGSGIARRRLQVLDRRSQTGPAPDAKEGPPR